MVTTEICGRSRYLCLSPRWACQDSKLRTFDAGQRIAWRPSGMLVLLACIFVITSSASHARPICHIQSVGAVNQIHSRRNLILSTSTAVLAAPPSLARELTGWETLDLEKKSRSAEGVMLPNGVRVVDVWVGDGPEPADGQQIYINYKFWRTRFDDGTPVDSTFLRGKGPEKYVLGSPSGRIFKGLDAGIRGMREGGWRRLTVPPELGFGDAGYPYNPQSSKAVPSGATLYVDVRLVDGGSGRCRPASETITTGLIDVKDATICKY